MPVRETVALLRELDPAAPDRPPARHRRHNALPRLAVGAAVAVAAALAIVTATGGTGPAPTLAEAAYTALTGPDHVVHLKLHSRFLRPKDDPSTSELWTRGGGDQVRVVFDGGEHEFVRVRGRSAASYVRHTNTVTTYTEPEMIDPPRLAELTFAGPEGAARLATELPALLDRARDGDPAVHRLPDATIGGRTMARLETTEVIGTAEKPGDPLVDRPYKTIVWIDVGSHLPRRIERVGPDGPEATTEVVHAERLAVDGQTERLLELHAPPGAHREAGGGR